MKWIIADFFQINNFDLSKFTKSRNFARKYMGLKYNAKSNHIFPFPMRPTREKMIKCGKFVKKQKNLNFHLK